jgi:putative ABC transport system permease protein
MNSSENIKLALNSIKSNFLRSLITLMIIAIGIAALVGILTALDVLLLSLSDNFSDMGANSFNIERKYEDLKGSRRGRRAKASEPISFDQAMLFKDRYDYPARVSVSDNCTGLATVKYKQEKSNPNVTVVGCDMEYFKMRGYKLSTGRVFSESEMENGAHKVLIGSEICKLLFDDRAENAIGKSIANGNVKYKVIGVLGSKGSSMSSNEDRMIMIPITNAIRYYDTKNSNYNVSVSVNDATQMDAAESVAIGIFRNIRRLKAGQDNDFETFKSDGIMEILKENTVTIRWATIFIGLATLIGAAIGLMNIMLVSVTERTREIGVCKALGASRRNILEQFLTEAIAISILGGIVGIILGLVAGYAVAWGLGGSFVMPWNWITLGFVLCFIVGVLSGLYPAIRASALDPIEALRYE